MTIGERLKKLRKALGLTQQEFADQLKVSRSNIATYEVGKNNPADAVINLICKTFNVSETWLRTDEGDMFAQRSEADELAAVVERLITGESAEFKRRLINALSTLKDEHWVILEEKLREIVGTQDTASAAPEHSGKRRMITVAARSGDISEIEEIYPDELPDDDDPIP